MRKPELFNPVYQEQTGQSQNGAIDRPLSRSLAEKVDFILKGGLALSVTGAVVSYALSTMPGPENYTTFLQNASAGLLMASVLFAPSLLMINVTQRTARKWMVFTQGQHHLHT